mgnify:FL=1
MALAKRVEPCGDLAKQITQAFELATGTKPGTSDIADLTALQQSALAEYRADVNLAKPLGGTPEKAAMAVVANAILNLDTVLTK